MNKAWIKRTTTALLFCYSILTVVMSGLVTNHMFMDMDMDMDMHKHDHVQQHFSIACNWACTAAIGSVSADFTLPADILLSFEKFVFSIREAAAYLPVYSISNRSPPVII